jgi:dihydrofolate synthase / folylpolyglutamate synthase
MTYDEAVRRLFQLGKELASPQQGRVQKFDLENIRVLSKSLGNPHQASPCAHIAGTNGKGSTAAMLESILRASGRRTGLYTSPHLERINERIRIAGEPIGDAGFAAAFGRVQTAIEAGLANGTLRAHPTFFEVMTAMAFVAFADAGADFVVYETGMGGRLDATNIVNPEVIVITQIDFDHESFLGHSLEQIASEKAGIIKGGKAVVSSCERPEARGVIAAKCAEVGARLVEIDSAYQIRQLDSERGFYRAVISCADSHDSRDEIVLQLPLAGRFQVRNGMAAAAAAKILGARFSVSAESIARGIATVQWPGRLERLGERPSIFLDGTHNPAGARELLRFWDQNFDGQRIYLVYGSVRDKAVDEIAGLLFPRADTVILTEPRQPRAISVALLAEMTSGLAPRCEIVRDPVQALERALHLAAAEDAVFVSGSLYLVGDVRAAALRLARMARPIA